MSSWGHEMKTSKSQIWSLCNLTSKDIEQLANIYQQQEPCHHVLPRNIRPGHPGVSVVPQFTLSGCRSYPTSSPNIYLQYIYICVIVSVYCFIYVYTFIYLQIYLHDGLQIQPKLQTLSLSMESYGVIHFASETKTRFFRQMSWRPQQHHGRCKIEEAQLNMTKRGCSFLIVYLQIRTHKVS